MSRGKLVWFNGKILPEENIKLSLFTHALHYGTGAFEGIRAYAQKSGGGGIFRLQEHLVRLFESIKILGFSLPYSLNDLEKACVETCRANEFNECYLRPIAYIGDGPLGVNPGEKPPFDVAILVWKWGRYIADHGKGARMKISSFIRPHINSIMTKGKITGHYINGVLAKREALNDGYDEALLLDAEGYLTEASGANLFMVRNQTIKTTPLNSILAGITRQTVIELYKHQGKEVLEQRFSRDELYCADEAFLVGTAAEITPIQEIDRRAVARGGALESGKVGPYSQKLMEDYSKLVRGEWKPEFAKQWITPI